MLRPLAWCRTGHVAGRALVLLGVLGGSALAAENKQVVGWIEAVKVSTEAVAMDAKVDTGADFSSVHADAIRFYRQNGDLWVEFTLQDQAGRRHTLQRAVVRMAKIKKKDGGFQERPVVTLRLCVGKQEKTALVNLAQRGHFKYPLLLGRSFLRGNYLVDPGSEYLAAPDCR